MIVIERLQKFNTRRKYRDVIISQVSALRDRNMSGVEIAKELNLPESTVRHVIKHIL